jgi:hypothetical protein
MTVTIKNVLLQSIRTVWYNAKFVILLWVINAASGVVLSVAIFHLLLSSIGRSFISDNLAHSFDYFWFIQFMHKNDVPLEQYPLLIYSVVVFYTLLQTFLLGGLIAVFNQPKKNHFVDFFYGGVKYFYRFFKVVLVSVLFYAFAFKVNDFTGEFITWMFKNSENVMGDFILRSLRYVLLVFLIGVVTLISDYSKVSLAINDKTKIIKQVYSAILFIKNNFNKVFIVFLIVACIGALGVVIYNMLEYLIPRTPYYVLIISFILQQMLIIFRLLIRMLFYATEVILYKDLSADILSAEIN